MPPCYLYDVSRAEVVMAALFSRAEASLPRCYLCDVSRSEVLLDALFSRTEVVIAALLFMSRQSSRGCHCCAVIYVTSAKAERVNAALLCLWRQPSSALPCRAAISQTLVLVFVSTFLDVVEVLLTELVERPANQKYGLKKFTNGFLSTVFQCVQYTIKNNNTDRPTKYYLPLTKMTNLSSEWKVGWFCRLKKICTFNELFLVFSFFLNNWI